MADISAVTATATLLDADTPDSLLNITFTVGTAFTYASSSVLYFYVLLTDGTTPDAKTRELTFPISKTTGGTFATTDKQEFVIGNTTNLVNTIVVTTSKIYYTA